MEDGNFFVTLTLKRDKKLKSDLLEDGNMDGKLKVKMKIVKRLKSDLLEDGNLKINSKILTNILKLKSDLLEDGNYIFNVF